MNNSTIIEETGVPMTTTRRRTSELLTKLQNLPMADLVPVEKSKNLVLPTLSKASYAKKLATDHGLFLKTSIIQEEGPHKGMYRVWRLSKKGATIGSNVTNAATASTINKN